MQDVDKSWSAEVDTELTIMDSPQALDIPLIPTETAQESHDGAPDNIPFPSSETQHSAVGEGIAPSGSSNTDHTSSDKLSALPAQSSPFLDRLRTPSGGRGGRRNVEGSSVLSNDSPLNNARRLLSLHSANILSESEPSLGKQITSFEGERGSLPNSTQSLNQAARITQHSDSALYSPSGRSGGEVSVHGTPRQVPSSSTRHPRTTTFSPRSFNKDIRQTPSPDSRSQSQSRNASPFRFLAGLGHRQQTKEEPFVPVNPFRLRICWFDWSASGPAHDPEQDVEAACSDSFALCIPLPALTPESRARRQAEGRASRSLADHWNAFAAAAHTFLTDVLPRQTYLILLLRLPALYFSRVARVFEDAELSKPDVQRMIDACTAAEESMAHRMTSQERVELRTGAGRHRQMSLPLPFPEDWTPPLVSPALVRFKHSWEHFVDSLLREWKTLNLISALLCTTILTMFQVESATNDPVIRSAALFSLIFALLSLSYGCVYIVQFGTMRSMDRASRWAEEAQRSKTAIWWNIWVLLATPAIWLAWAMITFCVSIMAFVWRTGDSTDVVPPPALTPTQALGVRIGITAVFASGVINLFMILLTFGTYGEVRREPLRGRQQATLGREPERGEAISGSRDRRSERDVKSSSSMIGLGLSGLGEREPGPGSFVSVLREEVDLEKREIIAMKQERERSKISPRL